MKTEHGVPIPRSVATLIVVGYAAGACAMLAFVIDVLPRRGLVLFVAVGIAGVAFVAAYLLMGQTRRHTRVLRAALGYRRGERPWPWRQHALQAVAHTFMLVSWILLFSSDDSDRRLGLLFPFWLLSVSVLAVSAVQKRRHERSDRERFGPPESYEAAQRFG